MVDINTNLTMPIPSWDELFLRDVYNIARKSKDGQTKIGAVIVRDNIPVSNGYNSFPRDIDDNVPARHERPEKYYWMSHAERNSIYNCAKNGVRTEGAIIYTNGLPCSECCDGIINSCIKKVVIHKQWEDLSKSMNRGKWELSCERSLIKLNESGVEIVEVNIKLNVATMIDGKIFIV